VPASSLVRRFGELLRESHALAAERLELQALGRAAKIALARLVTDFDSRPPVSRRPPQKGDLAGASATLMRSVLEWEDALCAAMWVRHDADASLNARRAAVAGEALKGAADAAAGAARAAEAARGRDEDEHRRAFRALHKLRGAEGERQRAAAGEALEQRRLLRAHEVAAAQARVGAAEERARDAAHAAEAARKQRDSLAGWRDHVRHAADALARAAAAPEGSPHHIQALSTAAALFKNNRDMFYHDEHFHSLRADLAARLRDCETAADEIGAVRFPPFSPLFFCDARLRFCAIRSASVFRFLSVSVCGRCGL
jgi:hypothetical protein